MTAECSSEPNRGFPVGRGGLSAGTDWSSGRVPQGWELDLQLSCVILSREPLTCSCQIGFPPVMSTPGCPGTSLHVPSFQPGVRDTRVGEVLCPCPCGFRDASLWTLNYSCGEHNQDKALGTVSVTCQGWGYGESQRCGHLYFKIWDFAHTDFPH